MKPFFVSLLAICFTLAGFTQQQPQLQARLQRFMELNQALNFDSVLAYTYPKMFTIVPRDEMKEGLENAFDNDQVKMGLDSLKVDSVYPVFSMQGGSYAKISYSMKMIMQFKHRETDSTKQQQQNEFILSAMQTQMGKEKVSVDAGGNIIIRMTSQMLAVKDKYAKDWCFVNLKDGDPILNQLFTKEILDKSATFH